MGLPENESQELIGELEAFATQDRFGYLHQGEVGDLIFWDNWRTMYTATGHEKKMRAGYIEPRWHRARLQRSAWPDPASIVRVGNREKGRTMTAGELRIEILNPVIRAEVHGVALSIPLNPPPKCASMDRLASLIAEEFHHLWRDRIPERRKRVHRANHHVEVLDLALVVEGDEIDTL